MNILLVNKYHFVTGGPESYMFNVTGKLEALGHKTYPLCLDVENNIESEYSRYFISSPYPNRKSHHASGTSPVTAAKLFFRSIYSQEAAAKAQRMISDYDIDVVYCLNIANYISPSVIHVAKKNKKRVLHRLSDYNLLCPEQYFFKNRRVCLECKESLLRAIPDKCVKHSLPATMGRIISMKLHRIMKLYERVDAFVCPSSFMRDQLVDMGFGEDKVHYLPSLVNVEADLAEQDLQTDRTFVLYLGRLSEEKGLDYLLDAMDVEGNRDIPLVLAGAGPEHESLREQAGRLANNIEFRGFVERDELDDLLRRSAFTVAPSIWHDNSPMSVFESLAAGKPIIATPLGGLRDQVGEEEAGLFVKPNDAVSLGNAIHRLWHDDALRVELSRGALHRFKTHFNPDMHMRGLLRLMEA
ncbi:MAG: glycosyltransferase family 4 protein [Oceanidesulfovibrio sp.]